MSRTPCVLFTFSMLLCACAVTQRLPDDVATAVARDQMRLLRTESIDLYYPAPFYKEAIELAERAEGCLAELRLRTLGRGGLASTRVELIFADLPYNNAFVKPPQEGDFFAVIPTHFTLDMMTEFGIPPAPSYVACHELTHYVQMQQTFRTLGGINRAFGYVVSPQVGLDAWFIEGLATYYETRLQPGTGRPAWPTWQGMLEAAAAGRKFRGGHLSPFNREVHVGNHYLYGSQFIAFLIERYGEEKLWKVVRRQGQSFFFPFLVNHRFKREYGKSLSALLDEFDQHLEATYPARARPAQQRVIRQIGTNGRYARAFDGSEAVVREAMDEPPTLAIYRADGKLEAETRLTDIVPPHLLLGPSSGGVSGLSFSRDGRFLYFVMVEPGPVYQRARLMRFDRSRAKLERVLNDLAGIGGDVSPDGRAYVFVAVSGHGHVLTELDLQTLARRPLFRAPRDVYLTTPRYSPDGRKIVASVFDRAFSLALFDTASGQRIETFSEDSRTLFDASFIDEKRLLFLREENKHFQLFTLDLDSRALTQLSDAPYLAVQPRAAKGTVRFFNRDGLYYTLDEITLTEEAPPASPVVRVGPPSPLPDPARLTLTRSEDRAASVFPRLLIPSLRTPLPFLAATNHESSTPFVFGFYLGGTDALGKHRWGASGGIQPSSKRVSGSVGYLNAQLAPLFLELGISQLDYELSLRSNQDENGDGKVNRTDQRQERYRQRDAYALARLSLRTTWVSLSAHLTDDYQPDSLDLPVRRRNLLGATLWVVHSALEGTPMSGLRRGLWGSLAGSAFPNLWSSLDLTFYDLRGGLTAYAPLPFSRRHTLGLDLRARGLVGAKGLDLIELGGLNGTEVWNRPSAADTATLPGLPPKRRFNEPLRGFETAGYSVSQIGIAELSYRYPLILDVGTATSLWLLPAFFLRQIDFELFASGAAESVSALRKDGHSAAGGALSVSFVWLFPCQVRYEIARRLTDDLALQQLVVVALGEL